MADASLKFLETFLNTSGPSGFETPQAAVFRDYLKKYADKIDTDTKGIIVFNKKDKERVLLSNEILNKYGVKEDFIKQFANCFEYYTKVFLSGQDGKTASGFAPEKRKARSEASKQRSREAAKKHWVKRHSK